MTLTLDHGPLSADPPQHANYTVDGPAHRLLFGDFPRRVRASFAGETLLDTRRGRLLHETGLLPQLYVPDADLRDDLLRPTAHATHCPFKGDASYWSVRVGDRVAENAVWAYPDPLQDARWLRSYKAVYWDRMDAWFDEDEQVYGHLRDPYHRVDVRDTTRRVRIRHDGEVIADARSARLLSETGLPNRYYIAREDVREEFLGTEPDPHGVPVQRDRPILVAPHGRPRDRGRGMVVPGAAGGRGEGQWGHLLLPRRDHRGGRRPARRVTGGRPRCAGRRRGT